jgi:hypothetical protein
MMVLDTEKQKYFNKGINSLSRTSFSPLISGFKMQQAAKNIAG